MKCNLKPMTVEIDEEKIVNIMEEDMFISDIIHFTEDKNGLFNYLRELETYDLAPNYETPALESFDDLEEKSQFDVAQRIASILIDDLNTIIENLLKTII